jgi:hypothetical protein
MKNYVLKYKNGRPVRPGDRLILGGDSRKSTATVVVVIPSGEACLGYSVDDWEYLKEGIIVEHNGPGGKSVVHYPDVDEDFVAMD